MKLFTKQLNAIYYLKDDITEEIIYGGAAGGGKSALGCLWLIENCQKYEGSRWLMGRAKLKTLKETTLNTFFELSTKLGINDQWNYNSQSGIIKWTNGSEILLKDLFLYPSDPEFDDLGSLEITGAFIDECVQIVYKAWQIVKSRIRYKLNEFGLIPKILGTCNPSKGWVYKQFYVPSRDGEIKEEKKFIKALPKDNPHLPISYIKNLLSLDETSKRRLHDGDWEYDDDSSTLIHYDSIVDYFVTADTTHVKPDGRMYLTIDVARKGKDKTVFRVWNGWLCIERVEMAVSRVNEVVETARKLQTKYGIRNSKIIADEDGVGGGVVDYLNCNGFVNNSKALYGENYNNLKSQCSIKTAKKINLREIAEICSDNTIIEIVSEEMEQIKLKDVDKDGKYTLIGKDEMKANIGRSPDDWDSIMMRMWFELTDATISVRIS